MNSTTPKIGGINYAKLRKQKSKEELAHVSSHYTIPKNYGTVQHESFYQKHRSTSQHNINHQQLFNQYFTCSPDQAFLQFIDQQIHYHQHPVQPLKSIFKTQAKKWNQEKQQYLKEKKKYHKENIELQTINAQLTKELNTMKLVFDSLHSRMYYQSNYNEMFRKLIDSRQDSISSLTDERFESNDTHMNSSFSDEANIPSPNYNEFVKQQQRRIKFSNQLYN